MLAGLCFSFVSSVSRAQCPTDIAPTNIAWNGPFQGQSFLMPGTTDCFATFKFCLRTVDGKEQIYIEDFGPDPNNWGSDCGDITWKSILDAVRENLFQSVTTDPCSHPNHIVTVVTTFNGSCAKMVSLTGGGVKCFFCGGAYCVKQCDLCQDEHFNNYESNCILSVLGTANCDAISNWNSLTVSAVSTNSWGDNLNQCYFINCDTN